MPSYSGRFEHLVPGEGVVKSGPCELSFDDQTATLAPGGGAPLAFDLDDIDAFTSSDCEIWLALPDGRDLGLIHFAKAFQDLERQLLEAYRNRLVKCLLVSDLDEVARFSGRVQLESPGRSCAGPAEIRLYESNLAVLPDAAVGFQWRLADIDAVEFDDANYAVVFARQGERLTVGRLAKRTGELSERVRSRITALTERTARTLHALFPFLSPGQFLQVAGLMRDGTCAAMARVRAIHPSIEPALVDKVVDGALKPYVKALADRAPGQGWYAGFKFIRRDSPEVGDGLEVLYWFFFPLASRGGAATHVAWEATSRGGRATYLFGLQAGAATDSAVATLNRGLVSLDFRREPVTSYASWSKQLDGFVSS